MDHEFGRAAVPVLACLLLLLPGCGSINVWPFGGESNPDSALVPANATEFQCAGGKRFYLRYLDNGSAAWIIFPDREFRLDKVASGGARYSNGIARLDVTDKGTTLTDGPGITFSGCKTDTK
jgi:hypothetical protein